MRSCSMPSWTLAAVSRTAQSGRDGHRIQHHQTALLLLQDLKRLESCVSWMRQLRVKPSPITLGKPIPGLLEV